MELKAKNYWNDLFLKKMQLGSEYYGKTIPAFNYVILPDTVLLYSNQFQIAHYEMFDWDSQTIHSWEIEADEEFWSLELSGFKKMEAIKNNLMGISMKQLPDRKWE